MNNQFTLMHLNGKYYVYTVKVANGKVSVNLEKLTKE